MRVVPPLVLLTLSAFCPPLRATAQYHFESWSTDNGLPQNSVKTILQTRDGYLWLTTSDGLVRYDGVRFTVFNKSNTPGIRSNRFGALFESRDGALWIGTEDGGITRHRNGVFTTFPLAGGRTQNMVWAFREDAQAGLVALTDEGLMRPAGEQFVSYTPANGVKPRRVRVTSVNSSFAFFDEGALHAFDAGRYRTLATADKLPRARIVSLVEDRRGSLWFVTADKRLNRFRDGELTTLPLPPPSFDNAPGSESITAAHEDGAGGFWIGWDDGRLSLWRDGAWATFNSSHGLPRGSLASIYEDREGTIWLGSYAGGLCRVLRQAIKVYAEPDGLAGENVYPIVEDRAGGVWLGVWNGGVYHFNGGELTRYTTRDGLRGATVTALYQDRAGTLWVGGTSLYRFENNRFTIRWDTRLTRETSIYAMTEDRAGRLWLGTKHGLHRFDDANSRQPASVPLPLPHQTVQALREDRNGNLWIGTLGGLCVLRPDGTFQVFTERDGLASDHVRAITEDREGILWIGTYDGGISRYDDRAAGKFTNYTTANGLFNNGAFQILEDDAGRFWVSCNLGIYRVSRQEMNELAAGHRRSVTAIAYGKRDGLLSLECNGGKQPAGARTRDGRLWFPTQRGVAVINPALVASNTLPPPVVIEDLLIDNENVAALSPASARDVLHLAPGQESLEIRYAGLSFITPEQVKFRFRLAGLDADWVEAGSRRVAYYRHLPPGEYIFQVLAANRDGIWNTEGASLKILVHPPFWRTWWFMGLLALGVLGLGVLVYEGRLLRLKRLHTAQESFSRRLIDSQEQERKRIAAELHDSLGQNLLIIKNRALLGAGVCAAYGAAKEQFDEINTSASHAIDEVRAISYNLRPYHLDRLGLTATIEDMIERITDASGVRFTVEIAPLDNLFPPDAEINLYRVVQECVNNIVKHAGATEARIEIVREGRGLTLTIQDDGRGFVAEADTPSEARRRGFGLTGIAERVRMLGGTHTICSAPGQGTTVTIKLTLPEAKGQNGDES